MNPSQPDSRPLHERVVLVDENDNPLGTEEKLAAHERGLLHRAVSVFIIRATSGGTEILLQLRAKVKYHFGGLWTNTCCGHPREGESVQSAGARRLAHEMGLNSSLEPIGSFLYEAEAANGLREHELDHVLLGTTDQTPTLHPDEAEAYRWISVEDLERELGRRPHEFTPWFAPALTIVREHLQ